MKRKLFSVITTTAMAWSLVACGGVTITSVGLPSEVALEKGATQQLQLEYSAEGEVAADKIAEAAGKLTVEWSSSDEAIVTVDAEGNVTAVDAGEAYITATVKDKDGLTATTLVRVAVTPTGVEAPETLELVTNGENAKNLEAKIIPEDATGVKLAYESSDEAVATVDENGMVTAVADGECVITAYVVSSEEETPVDTEVADSEPVDAASADSGEVADATVADSETASSDATVSEPTAESEQVFEPLEQETAETEETADTEVLDPEFATLVEDLKAETKVVVTTKVDAITLSQNEGILNVGKSVTLTATVTPEEIAADTTVTWSSSDEAVATVDSNGEVTAVATGNATITATAGEESATCDITVQKATSKPAASSKPTTNSTSGNTATGAAAPSTPAATGAAAPSTPAATAPSNPAPAPTPAPAAPTPAPAAPAPAPEPAQPSQPSGGDTNTDWWNTVIPGAADKSCTQEEIDAGGC